MNKFVVISFFLQGILIPEHSFLSVKEMKTNLFHKVNQVIQDTNNRIFTLLNLNKNFTSIPKNWLLLSMHATMKTIAEKNYQHYKDAQGACKIILKRGPRNNLFKLDDVIKTIVQESLTANKMTIHTNNTNRTGVNLHLVSFNIPDNSEESFAFLRDYLNKEENTDSLSIDSPLQRIRDEYEKNKVHMKRKLQTWHAPNLTKELTENGARRVFHGKSVPSHTFAFIASIHVMGQFVCGGSIISQNMIITAATCLQIGFYNKKFLDEFIEGVTVRVGTDYNNKLGKISNVSRIIFHPNYDPLTLKHNLALIAISTILRFNRNNPAFKKIRFQTTPTYINNTVKNLILLGWGDRETVSTSTTEHETISYSYLEIFDLQKCIETYSSKYVNGMKFCAGFFDKGAGACQRDVGGPGIIGSTLVGVVSFGPPICGTPGAPTVFTNIGYYAEWIDSIINWTPPRKSLKMIETTTPHPVLVPTPIYRNPQAHQLISEHKSLSTKLNTYLQPKTNNLLKSQYPKAIQVLTYLLNELLSAGQNIDDVIFGGNDNNENTNYDSDKEGPQFLREAQQSEEHDVSQETPSIPLVTRFETREEDQNVKETLLDKVTASHKLSTKGRVERLNEENNADYIDIQNKFTKITTLYTKTAENILRTIEDHSKVPSKTKKKMQTKAYLASEVNSLSKSDEEDLDESKTSESDVSDNYESEQGMSIEIPLDVNSKSNKSSHKYTNLKITRAPYNVLGTKAVELEDESIDLTSTKITSRAKRERFAVENEMDDILRSASQRPYLNPKNLSRNQLDFLIDNIKKRSLLIELLTTASKHEPEKITKRFRNNTTFISTAKTIESTTEPMTTTIKTILMGINNTTTENHLYSHNNITHIVTLMGAYGDDDDEEGALDSESGRRILDYINI